MAKLTKVENQQARDAAEAMLINISAADAYEADLGVSKGSYTTANTAWMLRENPLAVSDGRLQAIIRRQRASAFDDHAEILFRWVTQ